MSYYDTTILADSPVSYWNFADPSGTSAVDSADSNNGTYTAGFTLGGAAPFPGMSGSTAFNGSTGYVTVPDATNLHLTSSGISIEAWIKTSSGVAQMILAKYPAGTFTGFALCINPLGTSSGKPGMFTGATWQVATGSPSLADGYWHHVVGTYAGTAIKIYVDSVLMLSTTVASSLSNTTALTIGRNSAGSDTFFIGSIAAPAVYNSAISAATIAAHTWASVGTLTLGTLTKPTSPVLQSAWSSNMLAAYNLGEGSSTAADLSGNSHTGTLTGGCTWTSGSYGNQITLADNGTTGAYLDLGSLAALSGVNEFTFCCLCALDTYTDSPRGFGDRFLIGTNRAAETYPQSGFYYNSTLKAIHFVARYTNFPDLIAPAPPLNQWVLITGRITAAGEMSIWYDGVKIVSQSLVSYGFATDITPNGDIGDQAAQQTGNNWSGPVAMGLYATRGYLDAEIVALAVDPFVWARAPVSFTGAPLLPAM